MWSWTLVEDAQQKLGGVATYALNASNQHVLPRLRDVADAVAPAAAAAQDLLNNLNTAFQEPDTDKELPRLPSDRDLVMLSQRRKSDVPQPRAEQPRPDPSDPSEPPALVPLPPPGGRVARRRPFAIRTLPARTLPPSYSCEEDPELADCYSRTCDNCGESAFESEHWMEISKWINHESDGGDESDGAGWGVEDDEDDEGDAGNEGDRANEGDSSNQNSGGSEGATDSSVVGDAGASVPGEQAVALRIPERVRVRFGTPPPSDGLTARRPAGQHIRARSWAGPEASSRKRTSASSFQAGAPGPVRRGKYRRGKFHHRATSDLTPLPGPSRSVVCLEFCMRHDACVLYFNTLGDRPGGRLGAERPIWWAP